MPYIDPKMIDGVLPPEVLQRIHRDYFTWMQSGWKSNNRLPYEHGHNQHYILHNSKSFDLDMQDMPGYEDQHPGLADAFDTIQQIIGKRGLIRAYAKSYHYGQDAYAHRDISTNRYKTKDGKSRAELDHVIEDFETVIIYMSKDWQKDYYGSTLLYTDVGEIEAACLPKYNRAFIFDAAQEHSSSPLSRYCPINKDILVFNTMPIRQKDEGFTYLMEHSKGLPHSGKTFEQHLWNVYWNLEHGLKASRAACRAGLWHSVYGTVYDKHDKSKFTRDIVRGFIGDEAEKLVHQFCSYTTNRVEHILESGNADLMMIEFANLVDQNYDGKYNEKLAKLKSGFDTVNEVTRLEDESGRDTE